MVNAIWARLLHRLGSSGGEISYQNYIAFGKAGAKLLKNNLIAFWRVLTYRFAHYELFTKGLCLIRMINAEYSLKIE